MAEPVTAWAATGSWRGDFKLFAQIVERAQRALAEAGRPNDCVIEFAVREDLEVYGSVEELLERVPFTTWTTFRSARIRIGGPELLVEVELGRRKPAESDAFNCPRGVAVKVSSDGSVGEAVVKRVRSTVARVVERGGFSWASRPTEGPSEGGRTLEEELKRRRNRRENWTVAIGSGVGLAIILVVWLVANLVAGEGDFDRSLILVATGAATGVQIVFYPVAMRLFPEIEVAHTTPGRRMFRAVAGSGLLSALAGLGAAYAKSKAGL